jgi:hypothetical protein
MSKSVTFGTTALFACVLCAIPLSLRVSPDSKLSLSLNSATAEIGRPLTATSVAGVHRRQARRAYRRGNYAAATYGNGYGYGSGMYQTYNNYGYRPLFGTGSGWNQPWGGYAATGYRYNQPYGGYGYQQPYGGGYGYGGYYGQRHWTEF